MNYKRYLLFGMCAYYPEGGRHDVLTSFDTIEEVMNEIKSKTLRCDWYDVLDLEERCWIDIPHC